MDSDETRSTPAPPAVQQRHRQVRDHFCEQLAARLRTTSDEVVGHDGLGIVDRDYPFTAVFVIRLDGTWRGELGYSIKLDLRVFDGQPDPVAGTGPCVQCGEAVSIEASEDLPVTLFAWNSNSLTRSQKAQLLARGYDPDADGLIHDECWPAFKRVLKAKAARPIEEARS